ncbi:MAG TPA: homocysteine S-methyltransferase family protein [bacterium]
MRSIAQAVQQGRILVSDGAWGTFLHQKGLQPGECPESWNLNHRGDVLDIARSYIEAGADCIETNSFGASRIKLAHYGLDKKAAEINEAAALISREAAGAGGFVLGSIGPTGLFLITGEVQEEDLVSAFREQAEALERGGADAACIETMSALDEALCAVRAVRENTRLETVCTFTFEKTADGSFKTMAGVTPGQMAEVMAAAGADVIGTNCGNGMELMVEIVREIHAAVPGIPILVHANAGKPALADGLTIFPESPADMARITPELLYAGADIVGGCCGTTPEHIRAIATAVHSFPARNSRP